LAWSVAIVAAAIVILEKIVLNTVPFTVYALWAYILPTIFLLPFCRKQNFIETKKIFSNNKKEIFICSLLMMLSYFSALYSYKMLPISIAYPIIQSSTVFGVLIGSILFEDSKNMSRKIFAVFVAVLGVVVIKLF
jgi:multidrug transporter EmrE-like cation transporter